MFLFCLVFAMFCARLFICALWSPAGKGLTSWLSFVVSSVSLSLSHWYPGSGVVFDCIDSWSLHHYLLFFHMKTPYDRLAKIYTNCTIVLTGSIFQILTCLIWALWVYVTYLFTKCVTKSCDSPDWLIQYNCFSSCVITYHWNRCMRRMFSKMF